MATVANVGYFLGQPVATNRSIHDVDFRGITFVGGASWATAQAICPELGRDLRHARRRLLLPELGGRLFGTPAPRFGTAAHDRADIDTARIRVMADKRQHRAAAPGEAAPSVRTRQLGSLSQDFDFLAEADPMYAVLHERGKRRRQWDPNEFFATGQKEVEDLLARAHRLGFPQANDSALDFGSGLGRLSRALSEHFDAVLGVDISARMVDMATTIHKDNPKLRFLLNSSADLSMFPENHFDLIYTNKVLQHQPTADLVLAYVREFVRVLKPGGLLAAQVPEKASVAYKLFNRRRQFLVLQRLGVSRRRLLDQLGLHPVRMICLKRTEVTTAVESSGGRLLSVEEYLPEGPTYFATKAAGRS